MIFYILNSNQEIVETIQSPDTDGLGGITALNGIVDEKLDTYELLELVVPADADGLEKISENMTLIFEDISGWREYYIYEIEDEDGSSFTTSIRAELGSSELMDDIMEDSLRGVSRAPETVLGAILKDTRYSVGHVDSSINTQDFNIDTEYMNILELLNEYAGVFGAELRFSYQVDGNKVINRFVNVYKTYGEYRGKVFEIDRDMTSINRTVNTELIKTTIIPYSQEIEVENEDSNAPKETYRIDITDLEWSKALGDPVNKPKGQNYLVNEEVLNTWGTLNPDGTRRHKKISMEFDLDNAEAIASMAWVQLGRYAQPRVNYEVDGIDLYAMTRDPDLEHEKILLGDTLGVKDHYFAKPVNIQTRLVELERDLFDSRNNQYTFGTSKQLFSANASADKAEEMIKDVEELIKNMEDFQTSVDGSTKVFRGSNTPVDPTEGDLWFRPHPVKQGHTQMLLYTGVSWSIEADSSELEDASRLKFGVIDGAEINVINLIADNITGGQLKLENGIEITNKGFSILKANSAGEVEMNISKLQINAMDIEDEIAKRTTQTDLTNAINAIELKPGPEGKTAYDVAVDNGFIGTEREWIESLIGKQGKNGMTAYEVAVAEGFEGTKNEWLNSLEGKDGLPGQGVVSIHKEYYTSTSKTEQVDGEWSETPGEWEYGLYIWSRETITYRNPTEVITTEPVVSAEWEAVNQINYDGRNLLPSFRDELWILSTDYIEEIVDNGAEEGQVERTYSVNPTSPYVLEMLDGTDFAGSIIINVEKDSPYTMSFVDINGAVRIEGKNSLNNNILYTHEEQHGPFTFNSNEADLLEITLIRDKNTDGVVETGTATFSELKLEQQAKSSPWTPAPEDMGYDASALDKVQIELGAQGNTVKENEEAVRQALINLAKNNVQLETLVNLDIGKFMATITSDLQLFEFTPQGLYIKPNVDNPETYIELNSDGIYFYNGLQDDDGIPIPVASIEGQELNINKGVFVESLRVSSHSFDEGDTGHTQITYNPK